MTAIAAHLFLPIPLPQFATRSSSMMQVTLPPGTIQVGPESVYRHLLNMPITHRKKANSSLHVCAAFVVLVGITIGGVNNNMGLPIRQLVGQ